LAVGAGLGIPEIGEEEWRLRTSTNHLDEHRSHGLRIPYFSRESDAAGMHTVAGFQAKVKTQAIDGGH
jgi:hypothetical protein